MNQESSAYGVRETKKVLSFPDDMPRRFEESFVVLLVKSNAGEACDASFPNRYNRTSRLLGDRFAEARVTNRSFGSTSLMNVFAVDRPDLAPLKMPDRFRTEVVYFSTPAGDRGAPSDLGPHEYWIARVDAERWLEDLCFRIVSPLDAGSKAEIELSEEQEAFLEWITANSIARIRIE